MRFAMVNDMAEEVDIDMNIFALSTDGTRTPLKSASGTCGPDAATDMTEIDLSQLAEGTLLSWNFIASNGMTGEGHHVPETYKALELQPSGLEQHVKALSDGQFEIEISARGLALFVMIEADIPGRYSDNLFDLAAGETRRIVFSARDKDFPLHPTFKIFDLFSSQSQG